MNEHLADLYIELARTGIDTRSERETLLRLYHWLLLERKWLKDDRPHLKQMEA
jgi:hypothetical protein